MKKYLLLAMALLILGGCSPKEKNLKVISFNVRVCLNDTSDGSNNWQYRKEAAVKMIQTENPDFFGLQEALYKQAKYMEENLPEYTKYGVDRDGGFEKGEAESCAIFFRKDKYKLIDKGTFWLSETPETPSRGWDAMCHRVVTWVHLRQKGLGGEDIFFMNTHFDHRGVEARINSSHLLMEKVKEIVPEDAILLITGDFNAKIEDDALAPIVKGLEYSRETSPVSDSTTTFNNWGRVKKANIIDHIFYKNVTPLKYRTVTEDYGAPYISDHYPIVFEGKL